MGFWHTGYAEFHEPVGYGENFVPQKILYSCTLCGEIFDSEGELRKHSFENHPLHRPILLFQRKEVGSAPLKISREILEGDFQVYSSDEVRVNGTKINVEDLYLVLSRVQNDKISLLLKNDRVEANYIIEFSIASNYDLDGVDRCFFDLARLGRLDLRSVDEFIQSSKKYKTAINYYDGICEYFYGVLAKERASESNLNYEQYREKYNQAIDKLSGFDTELSRSIYSLIHFHFNHFSEAMNQFGTVTRAGLVSSRYDRWISDGDEFDILTLGTKPSCEIEKLLTDSETEQILQWGLLPPERVIERSEEIISRNDFVDSPFDVVKMTVLLAESFFSLGLNQEAKRYCRELINSPTLGTWANRLMGKIFEEGGKHVER